MKPQEFAQLLSVLPQAQTHTCSSQEECEQFLSSLDGIVAGLHSRLVETPVVDGAYCDMPGTCGPLLWELWHKSAESFRDNVCAACGGEAVSLTRGLHDLVNIHLGKEVFAQADLEHILAIAKEMGEKFHHGFAVEHDQDGSNITYPEGDIPPTIIREQEEGPGLAGVIPPELAEYKVQTYVRRDPTYDIQKAISVHSPSDLQPFFRLIRNADREWVLAFFVDVRNNLLGVMEANIGMKSSSMVSVDSIFEAALRVGASGIFIAHNHPSGDSTPSDTDEKFYQDMRRKCNLPELRVLDMIVVGSSLDYSIEGRRYIEALGSTGSPRTVSPALIKPSGMPPGAVDILGPAFRPPPIKRGQGRLLEALQSIPVAEMGKPRVIPREQIGFDWSILLPSSPSPGGPSLDPVLVRPGDIAKTGDNPDAKPGFKLFNYQEEAVRLLAGRKAALLADEMGVGKTAPSIAWAATKRPVLVVTPSSLVYNWEKEIKQMWRRNDTVQVVTDKSPFREALPDWTIISYGQAAGLLPELRAAGFKTLLVDEAHNLRNWESQRTQNMMELVDPDPPDPSQKVPEYRLAITGTPIVNDEEDLLPLLVLLGKDAIGHWINLDSFGLTPRDYIFTVRKSFRTKETFPGQHSLQKREWQKNLATIMIRRLKKDVLTLPPKTQTVHPVAITTAVEYRIAEQNFYAWIVSHMRVPGGPTAFQAEALMRLQALRGIASRGKVEPVAAMLRGCEVHEKVIIFSAYLAPLEELKKRVGGLFFHGSLGKEERQFFVERFQKDPNECYFLGTYGAAGVGITLTAADKVILMDLPWTPAAKNQAEDRAHRVGQGRPLNVVIVVAKGTVDERVLEVLAEKEVLISQIVEGKSESEAMNASIANDVLNRLRGEAIAAQPRPDVPHYISDEDLEEMYRMKSIASPVQRLDSRGNPVMIGQTVRVVGGGKRLAIVLSMGKVNPIIQYADGSTERVSSRLLEIQASTKPLVLSASQKRDPFGSRCRDPLTGMWAFKDFCGPLDVGITYPTPGAVSPGVVIISNKTQALSADGLRTYEFEHRAVEAAVLIPSHDPFTFQLNPLYSQKLQPRLRDRAAAELQVRRIAAQLSPEALLTDYHTLDRGAPIVGPDMIVESGNGRVMGILRAIKEFPDNYAAYRKALLEKAVSLGLDPVAIAKMKAPVLVRVRLTVLTPEERQAFAAEGNTPSGISRSAIEQARTDAEKVTLSMLERLDVREGESIFDALRTARNADFIRAFLGGVPENERGQLLDAQGRINQDGIRRAAQALFVAAFGSGEAGMRLGEMAFESADEDVRNIFNAISRSLAPLAKSESLVRARARDATLSIGEDLARTIAIYAKIKNDPSLTVEKYLIQSQMFVRELDPFQEVLLRVLARHTRSATRLGAIFTAYATLVIAQPPPEQTGMFGGLDRPTKEQLWVLAMERVVPNVEKREAELVMAQDGTGSEIRGLFSKRVRWCNTKEDAQERILQWRPLRNLIFTGLGYLIAVEVCEAGFGGDQYQVTIGYPAEGSSRHGLLTRGQLDALREAAKKLGNTAQEVSTRDPGLLVYQVTLPSMDESELVLKPQLTKKESDERVHRPSADLQPALFQAEASRLLPLIEEALGNMQDAPDEADTSGNWLDGI